MAGREHRREACRGQAWGQEEVEVRRESRAEDGRGQVWGREEEALMVHARQVSSRPWAGGGAEDHRAEAAQEVVGPASPLTGSHPQSQLEERW